MDSRVFLASLSLLAGCSPTVTDADDTSSTGLASSGTTVAGSSEVSSSGGPEPTTTSVADSSSSGEGPGSTTSGTTSSGSTTSGSTSSGSGSDSGDTTGLGDCVGQPGMGATAGMSCAANDDCVSGVCLLFQDVPQDADAVCGAAMPDCSTRFTGTTRDIVTQSAVSSDVDVLAILDALTNPAGADPIVAGVSGGNGAYDFESAGPLTAAIGVIGRVGGDGTYAVSGTALMSDNGGYAPGADIHELWLVTEDALDGWSDAMNGVPPDELPLGDAGGIVGFVRDTSGNPVAGATVAPESVGSGAIVRYPRANGSVVASQTDATGLFVIVGGMATGEDYVATAGGLTGTGVAGSAPQIVFMLPITVE